MAKDRYKEQFAAATAKAFRNLYPEAYKETGDRDIFDAETIYNALEKPKDPEMGRFALPIFRYVRLLKDKPAAIAAGVAPGCTCRQSPPTPGRRAG